MMGLSSIARRQYFPSFMTTSFGYRAILDLKQNTGQTRRGQALLVGSPAETRGKVKVQTEPPSGRWCRVTEPPYSMAVFRANQRPMPRWRWSGDSRWRGLSVACEAE